MKFVFATLLQRKLFVVLFVILGTATELETQIPLMQKSVQPDNQASLFSIFSEVIELSSAFYNSLHNF